MDAVDRTISRRGALLAGVGVAAAATATAAPAAAAPGDAADVIVIGAGLAGLVATAELADAGRKVLVLDQEGSQSLGGQAFWSFGGLFLIDSDEQRLAGVRDSIALARQDWAGTAGFDRGVDDPLGEDYWGARWAEAYLNFAATEKRRWLASQGMSWVPIVGWAERGGQLADGPGNSVPRFHVTMGTGPGVLEPFLRRVQAHVNAGRVVLRFRHRVDSLVKTGGAVSGAQGSVLEPTTAARGVSTSRTVVGSFEYRAPIVLVASGGIGGNTDLVRSNWPARLGTPPQRLVIGVPAHVDGRMLAIGRQAGARLVNQDRMWHYTEGLQNHSPVWPQHGIRILPGPSSLWFDAKGNRFQLPALPGYDTLGTLKMIQDTGYDYSWFILNKAIVDKEFTLSGSEQNPELTNKDLVAYVASRLMGTPAPVKAFLDRGRDFVTASNLRDLVAGMNRLTGTSLLNYDRINQQVVARDRQITNGFTKDVQVMGIRNSRDYLGDSLFRTVEPAPLLSTGGPLIAVRLNILTRKTLGGMQTDLSGRVLDTAGKPVPGLYAAGEVSGFGGGGVHGYRSLEGTFLGGCIFSGRGAGRAAAAALA